MIKLCVEVTTLNTLHQKMRTALTYFIIIYLTMSIIPISAKEIFERWLSGFMTDKVERSSFLIMIA